VGSTNVLLSVKPQHAEAIVQGRKKYELRRTIFKREDIGRVYVYSTAPVSKLVGSFEVGKIIQDSPKGIWETCHKHAAIAEDEFFDYFEGAVTAFAIKIANMQRFTIPIDPHSIFDDFKPPRSFRYFSIDIKRHKGIGNPGRAIRLERGSGKRKAPKPNR